MRRLALLVLAVFVLSVADAHAGGPVRIDAIDSTASVQTPFGNDFEQGDGLTFSHDLSVGDAGVAPFSRTRHDSAVTDAADGLAVASSAITTALRGPDSIAFSNARHSVEFTVLAPVDWRLSGALTVENAVSGVGVSHLVELRAGDGVQGFDASVSGPFSGSGTLPPGTYELRLTASAGNARADLGTFCRPQACSGGWEDVEFVVRPAASVAVTGAPPALSNQRSATFSFEPVGTVPPGRFECAVDGSAFTPCASPVTAGGLADGEHVFAVRYHPDGEDPGPAVERRWTVDTTLPAVIFDAAPSGEGNGRTADIAFHSTERDGAVFRCSLDGGLPFDCSSPHRLADLAPGPHTFTVETIDRAGNVSPPVVASWSVAAPQTQTLACAAPASDTAGFGVIRLVARAAGACFVDETVGGRPAKVSRGEVTLNGIRLTPAAGTRIIVAQRVGGGTVRTDGPVTVAFGTIAVNLGELDLDNLTGPAGVLNRTLALIEGYRVAGMRVAPSASLDFSDANGGQTKVSLRVTLPRAFRRLAGQDESEGVTVEFSPTVSNDLGVTFAGRVKLNQVRLFGVEIKELDLAYDHASGVFDGAFGLELGRGLGEGFADPTITGRIGIAATSTDCFLAKLGLEASNLQRHISHGVFLQRLGGAFECVREEGVLLTKLSASAGLSLGPRIAIGSFEAEAISLDGAAILRLPVNGGPASRFSFELIGAGKIVDFPVTLQRVKLSPVRVDLEGDLDLTIAGYGARLRMLNSFLDEQGFNFEYSGEANLFGLTADAQALVSTFGFAACTGALGRRIGFGKNWAGPLQTFGNTCDVGDFRDSPAQAAQAGPRGIVVAPRTRLKVLEVAGTGRIAVSGPGGRRIETPAGGGAVRAGRDLLVPDTEQGMTFVVLVDPPAGRWAVESLDGSPVGRVRIADGLPPVRIRARVTGRGDRRTLKWRASGIAGHSLQFVARAPGRAQVLATTRRARGRLRFRPELGTARRRVVEAIVVRRGIPRLTRTVARFTVATPARPGRVSRVRLRGRELTWRAARGAAEYEIAVTRPDRTTTLHSSRRAKLRLGALPRRGRIRVEIVALDALERPGRLATARLKLGRR